ncbi:bifunctional 6-phosphofructo-2-kinase fructose-bisphosphate 2-phosphatase [Nannochloropsis oceanica]
MAISAWAGLAQAYQSATASVAGGIDAWIDNVAAPLFVLSGLSATLLSILCKRKQGLLEKHRNQPKRLDLETTQARPLGSSSKSHNHSRSLLSPLSAQAATQNLMGSGYERRLLVAMVGLPARGKSYITEAGPGRSRQGFFDSSNESAAQAREEMAAAVLDEAYEWLGSGGDDEPRVAFFDATNTTMMRRSKLLERNRREKVINIATLEHLQLSYPCVTTSLLNELRGGDMDGWNRDDIKTMRPDVYNARETDKLNYRYPGAGESYTDVMQRVRPVIIELERQRQSVVVISHLAVQRCLYAYFMGIPPADLPYLQLPHHTVYELEPGPFGCRERRISLFELDHLM